MNTMQIAFSTLAFPNQPLAEVISLGRSWGYTGVELRVIDGRLVESSMPAAERARVKQTVAAAGLAVASVGSPVQLLVEHPASELQRFLEIANEWESPVVRIYGGRPLAKEPGARRTQMEAAARELEAAVPLAERLGVALAIETHDAFSASAVVAELLALVDSKCIGAIWDSHHPHRMGETPAEVYENIGRRILHTHVKDARKSETHKGGWQLVLLGEGEVPVREMLALLGARGYDGWVTAEWEKYWHPEIENAEIALPQHLKLLQEWLQAEAR